MKFAIISHAVHKHQENMFYAYAPYVNEINLWLKKVTKTRIVAPVVNTSVESIETFYNDSEIALHTISSLHFKHPVGLVKAIFQIPFVIFRIYKAMQWADHIHLRCPGNIGLLGCFVQVLFPNKPKTVKYAGNWDPKSKQPISYRLQKRLLSNTTLTKNCKVLVYGHWPNQTKNIVPFFTSSYSEKEIEVITNKTIESNKTTQLLFVGGFTKGKQPLLSVQVAEQLSKLGKNVHLNMFGHGTEFQKVSDYIKEHQLDKIVTLHGNQPKEVVKKAYQTSHFLVFISKSEGWPKVVAEAMFWGCVPITTKVSCVSDMLGDESRGSLVTPNTKDIVSIIDKYFSNPSLFERKSKAGMEWSRNYTLESFEKAIHKLLN